MATQHAYPASYPASPALPEVRMSSRVGLYSILAANFGFWFATGIGVDPFTLSISQIFIAVAFATCLFQWFTMPDRIPPSTRQALRPIIWVSIAMMGVGMGSMITAAEPIAVVRFLSRWVFGLIYIVAFVQFVTSDKEGLGKAIRAFLFGGVATVPVLLVGYFYRPIAEVVFWDLWSYRSNGFLEHPNQFAMVCLAALVLAQLPKLLSRKLWIGVVSALVFGLITAGSKTNMALAILIIPVVFFWLPAREGRAVEALGGIIAGLIAALLGLAAMVFALKTYNNYYYRKLEQFLLDPTGADTTQSRGDTWVRAIDCMLEKPVFGIGGGNADQCIDYVHAHNVFINYLLETGVLGLILITAFFALVIYAVTRVSRKLQFGLHASAYNRQLFRTSGLVLVAIVLFIISNSSSDSLGSSTMPVMWMLAGIPLAMNTIIHRKAAPAQSLPRRGQATTRLAIS